MTLRESLTILPFILAFFYSNYKVLEKEATLRPRSVSTELFEIRINNKKIRFVSNLSSRIERHLSAERWLVSNREEFGRRRWGRCLTLSYKWVVRGGRKVGEKTGLGDWDDSAG